MTTKITVAPKPAGSYWSDDQWKAITLTGGDILVAAAAGSGKTAVLVERIIRKLSAADTPLSVDRLLVATFTKAAAAEMRQRIREALEKELERNPGSEHLGRQLAMLGRASITTLHSFCMEVIQRYYTLIPLDPGFRIASESEAALLRQEVLEQLFEEKYASEAEGSQKGEAFVALVDWFGGERSDDAVFVLVQKLYDFARSHSWPEHWLDQAASAFAAPDVTALEDSLWVGSIMNDTVITLDGVADLLRQAIAIAGSPDGPKPYADTLEEDLRVVDTLRSAIKPGAWSGLYDIFQSISFGKLKPCKKDQTDPILQERVKGLREDAKKMVIELRNQLYGRTAEQFLNELHQAAPVMKELSSFITEFSDRYQQEKQKKGWLDFSDLEHYCLQILRHPDSTPDGIMPSDAALEYQAQYDEVLLDEYQDTNTVQEDIVRLISRGNLTSVNQAGNRFMVGDVKQSIYRFRLAEPGLFLDKYKSYGDDFEGTGLRIDLARNFRSRKEVVNAVNLLFRQVMNEGVAEISYDSRAELVYGEGFPEDTAGQDYRPELLLIDRSTEDASSSEDGDMSQKSEAESNGDEAADELVELEAVRLEARAIAARIIEMTGGSDKPPMLIYDKMSKKMKPVGYSDIVILLRSTLSWAPVLIEELRLEGIPASGELSQGYFQASEVETMLSLLQIIDNPLQDIPLAAVLRSPLFSLSEEELAEIRLALGGGSYYDALLAFVADEQVESGAAKSTLKDKLQHFLIQLNNWRNLAGEGELSSLIWSIYRDTGYLDWVGGLPGGTQRQGNLRALHDRARQYEMATSSRGLFTFLRYMGRLRENGGDLGAASVAGGQEDTIKIMTIHKSKGLEFPVVFVAGLSKMFNRQDLNAPFLMHKEMGFGPKFVDSELRVSYPTLPNLAIRRRAQMELLAEEMRVLYVAMTRPKDKLILISSVKDLAKSIEVWGGALEVREEKLPDYILARGRCYLDWIGPSLIRHPAASELRQFGGLEDRTSSILADRGSDWIIAYSSAKEIVESGLRVAEAAIATELASGVGAVDIQAILSGTAGIDTENDAATDTLDQAVKQKLNWSYPYAVATGISAKTSVTEMKSMLSRHDEDTANLFVNQELRQEAGLSDDQVEFKLHLNRPRFMEQIRLTPTERGTAYHTLMQHLPLDHDPDEGQAVVTETLQRLIDDQIMTKEQTAAIDISKITSFLQGPVGDMLRHAEWIHREMPFTYGLAASDVHASMLQLNTADVGRAATEQGIDIQSLLDQETVLIQGVVDCLFYVDGKQYLLDYKSDRVLAHQGGASALAEMYRFQLELYAAAVEAITGVAVDGKWLYFFDTGEAIQL